MYKSEKGSEVVKELFDGRGSSELLVTSYLSVLEVNSVAARLLKGDEMLADARLMLQNGHLKSAANRAYYAIYHAAQVSLAQEVARLPESHKGIRALFARYYVATHRVDRSLSRDLTFTFELGQASSYLVDASSGEEISCSWQ